ncbi:MAG: rod shape-determining protein, partial [Candidatus Omnitrophica bacterium]|nr:rod shape-determining protein [Candidatus Omnitrophota bacterium]
KSANKLQILGMEKIEHKSRTMLDGQIHNINEVAKTVRQIKANLEETLNISLRNVGVAVAGRSLNTIKAKIEKTIPSDDEISEDAVRNLELEAVSSVLNNARHDFGHGEYYCVGYSVIYYALNGEQIGSLAGHFGRSMAVEVIATFLPRVVLDSMLSVLRRCELEITNLTLEPIAAINAIIPQDIRALNLALLDIGAGTSDIALTKDGTVVAYGMVPEAGDEITELICEKYILDFTTAETVKRSVLNQREVTFRDILGRVHSLDSEKVIESIRPRVKELAASIARCVCDLNQKVPCAVVLVGGGSLTPLLEGEIAEAFGWEASNVGIRLPEMVEGIEDTTGKLQGPDMVTPLGISIMIAQSSGLKFLELQVNNRRIHVLDMRQKLDVLSALVAAGVDKMRLYGKIGRAICAQVNGELKAIKGKMGKPAQIKLNGEDASLTAKIKNKDSILFTEAENGEDAQGKVADIIDSDLTVRVEVNGQSIEIKPQIIMNGLPVELDAELPDRAVIEYPQEVLVKDALERAGVDIPTLQEREIVVRVNKEPRVLTQRNFTLMLEGKEVGLETPVKNAGKIEFSSGPVMFFKIKDVVEMPPLGKSVNVILNGMTHVILGAKGKIFMNGQEVTPDEFLIDRAEIATRPGGILPPTVAQVLEHVSFKPEEQRGKLLRITVNGQPAGFTTQLCAGAEVMVNFVEV